MNIKDALNQLAQYADDFAQVGDAKEAIAKSREDFLHKWTKVMQYYNYIMANVETMSDEWFEAVDVMSDIIVENPSLEKWVQQIMGSNAKTNTQTSSQTAESKKDDDSIDPSALSNKIESFVSEIRDMQIWDEDRVGDIE